MTRSFVLSGAHRLLLCLGPGGVGKTTTASALGLRAALEGGAVDVMTIDPAPRLLDALGLNPAIAEPQEVAIAGLSVSGSGRMRALKLDPKRTFDGVIERNAPSRAIAETILDNRLYRNLSDALAGIGDYMAMEKLLELYENPADRSDCARYSAGPRSAGFFGCARAFTRSA